MEPVRGQADRERGGDVRRNAQDSVDGSVTISGVMASDGGTPSPDRLLQLQLRARHLEEHRLGGGREISWLERYFEKYLDEVWERLEDQSHIIRGEN